MTTISPGETGADRWLAASTTEPINAAEFAGCSTRTAPLYESATYTLTLASTATPTGPFKAAVPAGPPSPDEGPEYPPMPAIVVIIPSAETLRMRPAPASEM